MNELTATLLGNLTADPELRFTKGGKAVANFTIAHTVRTWDREQGKMVDGDTVFMRCTAWAELGEHVAESLRKGNRVLALAEITQRKHENVTYTEATVRAIGPDLLFTTAVPGARLEGTKPAASIPAAADPWQSPPDAQGHAPLYTDEPPF